MIEVASFDNEVSKKVIRMPKEQNVVLPGVFFGRVNAARICADGIRANATPREKRVPASSWKDV